MKLEWNSLRDLQRNNNYCWECGIIVNFDTPEARARSLRVIDMYSDMTPGMTYGEEFVVTKINELKNRPKHLTKYEITLVSIRDGFIDESRKLVTNWPSELTGAAKYLRKVESVSFKFPKDASEIISANEIMQKR